MRGVCVAYAWRMRGVCVLRNWCLSVDEPILGSTPALRHPWRACHTNPEARVEQRRC